MELSPITQARCAHHPDAPTVASCARCGDYLCSQCVLTRDAAPYCEVCAPAELRTAQLSARFGGRVVDNFSLVVAGVVGFMFGRVLGEAGAFVLAATGALGVMAYNIHLVTTTGQSFGKRVSGTRVISVSGGRVSGWTASVRELVPLFIGFIPMIGGVFSIVDIAFVLGSEKRRLVDRATSTRVVEAEGSARVYGLAET